MPRPISVHISLAAMRHNLAHVRSYLPPPTPYVWAVIKANAYGHGIKEAVQGFAAADGLAMLDIAEVVRCRELGWTKPLLLLEGFFDAEDLAVISPHHITVVIHSSQQIALLQKYGSHLPQPVDVLAKINTGMNRLGFAPEQFESAFSQLQLLQQQGIISRLGKMTHFARADDDPIVTQQQLQCFNEHTAHLSGSISVCNSAATLTPALQQQISGAHEQWVRPGICLYGASPFAAISAQELGLLPVQSLMAEIISIRHIAPQQGVGYGHHFLSPTAMRIGVVACGYADGYPRHAPSGTPIVVNGQRTQLIGRVSMDMLMVDLTPLDEVQIGAKVVLWGQGGPSVDEVAQASGTIGYELLCAVAARVPRVVSN